MQLGIREARKKGGSSLVEFFRICTEGEGGC